MSLPTRKVGRIAGAVAGQLSQALASFVLQVIAARALGASGLGTYALLYSVIVTAAALSNGLIGDSLTVLDRGDRSIRAGLVNWAWLSSVSAAVAGGVTFAALGVVSWTGALLFALAASTFMLEGSLRRLLMAVMRFWNLVLVDGMGMVVSLLTLVIWHLNQPLDIDAMLLAWVTGQTVASVVAVVGLPAAERRLAVGRRSDMRGVFRFGGIRAAQQTIRPSLLTAARVMMTLEAGRAAFGRVEAARVYMAPALLVVQGLGSYLFASYASRPAAPMAQLIRRADLAAAVMVVVSLGMGALAALASPWAGSVVTGSSFSMSASSVFGWATFAAATAANMPYGSLAAVRGRQTPVLGLAVGTALLTLAVMFVLHIGLGLQITWVPYVLAAGSLVQGGAVRWRVLLPLNRADQAVARPTLESSH